MGFKIRKDAESLLALLLVFIIVFFMIGVTLYLIKSKI